jgi:hypothetical protein
MLQWHFRDFVRAKGRVGFGGCVGGLGAGHVVVQARSTWRELSEFIALWWARGGEVQSN